MEVVESTQNRNQSYGSRQSGHGSGGKYDKNGSDYRKSDYSDRNAGYSGSYDKNKGGGYSTSYGANQSYGQKRPYGAAPAQSTYGAPPQKSSRTESYSGYRSSDRRW